MEADEREDEQPRTAKAAPKQLLSRRQRYRKRNQGQPPSSTSKDEAHDEIVEGASAPRPRADGVQLRAPRALPPHEPEDPRERPCQCPVCLEVPSAAGGELGEAQEDPLVTLAGVYPRGLGWLALDELARAGLEVLDHMPEHAVILFRPPACLETYLELSTFNLLFEALGGPFTIAPAPRIADIARAADSLLRRSAKTWRKRMRAFSRWRMTSHRDQMITRFKAPEVLPVVGDALAAVGAVSMAFCCTAGPVVSLDDFEVEVVIYLSDGVDKLRAAADTNGRDQLLGGPELMLLGVQSRDARVRLASLSVEKGSIISRADDTVALCIAQRAADLLGDFVESSEEGRPPVVRILDPMCGVGTYLMAMRWVLSSRAGLGLPGVQLIGVEIDETSADLLLQNDQRSRHCFPCFPLEVIRGSSLSLPLADASVDLIVVDPPWGQRHSSNFQVKKNFPNWAREWARVLKPGGAAIIITIVKRVFEELVLPPLQRDGLLELEQAVQFDNKGWRVCRLYVVRRKRFASDGTQAVVK